MSNQSREREKEKHLKSKKKVVFDNKIPAPHKETILFFFISFSSENDPIKIKKINVRKSTGERTAATVGGKKKGTEKETPSETPLTFKVMRKSLDSQDTDEILVKRRNTQ